MAGLTPVANQISTPDIQQYQQVLNQARSGFVRMSPSEQLQTTRFLNAKNHDLVHATGGNDPRLSATRQYIEAASRLEEAKQPQLANKMLKKAAIEWDVASGVHNRIPPAIRPASVNASAALRVDPRETARQQHLHKIAMPIHEGPGAQNTGTV